MGDLVFIQATFFGQDVLQPVAPVAFSTGSNVGTATGDQISSSFTGEPEGNLLALLNDPSFLLQGIDYVLEGADLAIDTVLDSISLPIIGDNLATSFTVLDDLRFDVIAPAIAFSQTPGDDGSTPTTTELLDGFVNDQINDVLGTSGVTYLQSSLQTPVGDLQNSFLFSNLGFSKELFSTTLNTGLDLDIPGFDIEFSAGTPLTFKAFADFNLGFGVDSQGFFLLNDQDLAEAAVTFVVDGGDFEGEFTIGNALTLEAFAIVDPLSLAAGVFSVRPDFANDERGDLSVTAALQADLFGDLGVDQVRDLSAIDITRGDGTEVVFESIVRIPELSAAPIASVSVNAVADINLQLNGEFTDPSTGERIPGIPNFATDVVIDKFISTSNDPRLAGVSGASAGGSTINLTSAGAPPLVEVPDQVLLHNMRVDVSDVFDNIISPVLSPLSDVFDPLGDLIEFIDRFPLSEALDAAESAVPLLGLVTQLGNVSDNVDSFLNGDFVNDGFVNLGSFEVLTETYIPPVGLPAVVDANLGIGVTGLSVDLPIITDIHNFLNLMRGNYAQVDLVTATLTAIDIVVEVSLRDRVLDAATSLPGIPDELAEALLDLGSFNATLDALAKAAFTVGYDLSGIISFVETQDPTRVLDGIFLDASQDVVDLDLDAEISAGFDASFLGTGVEGSLTGSVSGSSSLSIVDPNGDGKLRLNELDELLAGVNVGSFSSFAGSFFDGDLSVSVGFNAEAKIKFTIDSIDFDTDFFEFTISIDADDGGPEITPVLTQQLQGGTIIGNVGARIGQSFLNANDGINVNDPENVERITIFDFESGTANNGRYVISYDYNDQDGNLRNFSEEVDSDGLILALGNGVNTLVMKDVRVTDSLIFAGEGLQAIDKDPLDVSTNISLSNSGFHVVFGGDTGNHIVTESPTATGTYWIFGGAGQDNIQVTNSDALIFGEDTFGFQEAFAEEFKDGNFNEANAKALMVKHLGTLGFTVDDTLDPDAQFDAAMALFSAAYTQATQFAGSDGQDRIGVGNTTADAANTAHVFAGRGSDIVTVQSSVEDANVYLGAGNDLLNVRASASFVEGGAGSDFIDVGDRTFPDPGRGNNIIIGDSGQIDLSSDFNPDVGFAEFFVRSNALVSGDRITVDNFVSDVIVLDGSGDDRITLRSGTHAVLGDHGTITFDAATREILVVNGMSVDGDGNDTVTGPTDSSRDFFVALGGGDDVLFTTNNAIALGDGGTINLIDNFVQSDDTGAGDGNDRLSAGRNLGGMQIGGGGDDTFDGTLAPVDAIGDSGRIEFEEIPLPGTAANQFSTTRLESFERSNDGNDTFNLDRTDLAPESRTDHDHNIIMGGGDDTVTAGDGVNRIIGDGGIIDLANETMIGASSASAGDDVITVGDGDNEIIGGAGNDTMTVGTGNNDILGDDGFISLKTNTQFIMRSTNLDTDGADSITAGNGLNRVILGGNDDIARFGDGNNQIIGDGGTIDERFSSTEGRLTTDGRDIATAIEDGDDQITIGFGSNQIIGGAGADTIIAAQVASGETAPANIGDNAIISSTGVITFATAGFAAQTLAWIATSRAGRGWKRCHHPGFG